MTNRIRSTADSQNTATEGIASTTGSPTFETAAPIHGTASYRFDSGAANAQTYHQWGFTAQALGTDHYLTFYLRIPSASGYPATTAQIAAFLNGTSALASLRLTTTGTIELFENNFGTVVGSASAVLSTNTTYRVDFRMVAKGVGATDVLEARLNGVLFASTAVANMLDLSPSVVRIGWNFTVPGANEVVLIDTITYNDSLLSGPDNTWSRGFGETFPPYLLDAGTAVYTATSGTALVPGLPAGWAADDIHVLLIHSSSNVDLPEPTGWTKLSPSAAAENNTTAQRVELWYRRAVAGDAAPSVGAHASATVRGARIYGVRGCLATGDPFVGMTRANNAASATVATASLTPTANNALLLFLYAYEDDPTAASQPTEWSLFGVSTSALGLGMALGHSVLGQYTAAARLPTTVVSGGTFAASPSAGILLALAPAAAAISAPPYRPRHVVLPHYRM